MFKKAVYLLLVVAIVMGVGFLPNKTASAQRPQPPTDRPAPQVDLQNLPLPLQKDKELRASMSPDQKTGMANVLLAHMPEFKDIINTLNAQGKSDGTPKQVDKELANQLTAILKTIDSELAAVLSADQMALYRAVVMPDSALDKPVAPTAGTDGYYTDYCFYGTYDNAYAKYYAYYGYLDAYYHDYILYYYGYSDYYAYYAYIYAYYGYLYSRYALDYSAPTYISYYYFNLYTTDYPYYAYYYSYYAEAYQYYAYLYAYYSYYYEVYTDYGYYSYYENYYGWYGAYYAEYYTYYCYYYSY